MNFSLMSALRSVTQALAIVAILASAAQAQTAVPAVDTTKLMLCTYSKTFMYLEVPLPEGISLVRTINQNGLTNHNVGVNDFPDGSLWAGFSFDNSLVFPLLNFPQTIELQYVDSAGNAGPLSAPVLISQATANYRNSPKGCVLMKH